MNAKKVKSLSFAIFSIFAFVLFPQIFCPKKMVTNLRWRAVGAPSSTSSFEEKMNTLKLVDFCLIFLLHTARILVAVSMLQARFWSVFF
jgi:hypothetical protein